MVVVTLRCPSRRCIEGRGRLVVMSQAVWGLM